MIHDTGALQNLLDNFIQMGGPVGCGLSVSFQGKLLFRGCTGYADLNGSTAFHSRTIYRLFSDTKLFTVTAAMMLYEMGCFLITDPVEKYLPCFSGGTFYENDGSDTPHILPVSRPVTIQDLMRMTSGLPYGGDSSLTGKEIAKIGAFWPNEPVKLQDFVKELAKIPLAYDPGTHWSYGYGIDVLGALIEVWSGRPFGEFLSENIWKPLGMEDTSFVLKEEKTGRLADVVTFQEGKRVRSTEAEHLYQPDYLYESGGGGLLSTLEDMSVFTTMLSLGGTYRGARILGPRTIDLMRRNHLDARQLMDFQKVQRYTWPNMLGYGYGLGVRTMMDPVAGGSNSSPGEFGWSGAAGSWTMIDPDLQLCAHYVHQLMPSTANLQEYCHPRLRNAIYSLID
ncbi:beta-lactamase family protein [Lachnospiraceae bacterium ASD3451]|uniref:serine hydrolase domain-containing protein n=1 Tax=Diplocloster agilis TaxID=2850323 RepID=UPI001DBD05CD|nr:serine hydrolase domain-containing protein [Diplocloster agilis]MBU9746806.1 beta-lactamase family protein [Diplocloster agilis]